MFPLGSVLFPTMVLPLHVFEPRYRALVRDVMEGDGEFGVCLIERGHEVGGGDVRSAIGTMARLHQASELPDGRWAVVAVGDRRIRVRSWLDDDPYPRADVEDHPDPAPIPEELVIADDVVAALRAALAKATELGEPSRPATVELSDDPTLRSLQASALAPISTFDQQRLLAAEGVGLRLAVLAALLDEANEVLDLRLRSDGSGEG